MKPILRLFIFITLIFSGLCADAQTGNNVKIQIIGDFTRCTNSTDTILKTTIVPNPTLTWSKIKLDWGEGNPVNIFPGGSLMLDHIYSPANFIKECYYPFGEEGFTRKVFVDVKYTNGTSENVGYLFTFKNAPKASFSYSPNQPCIDQVVFFKNETCPANDPKMKYQWFINSILKDTTKDLSIKFLSGNTYTVKLIATNECGTSEYQQTLVAFNKPIARIKPDSGFVTPIKNPPLVCLGGGGTVKLDGAIFSQNETTYKWSFPSFSGITYVQNSQSTNPIIYLNFTTAGTFPIKLTVSNPCGALSDTTLNIKVVAAENLKLDKQMDACITLSYTPSPLNKNAIYYVDDTLTLTTSFPKTLFVGNHKVKATLVNDCGKQDSTITFSVVTPTPVSIKLPTKDTTVCAGSPNILLNALPSGGIWSGNTYIVQQSGKTYLQPNVAGTYTLTYTRGSGNCETKGSVKITVTQDVVLDLQDEKDACETLSYTPFNFNQNAIYVINKDTIKSFPIVLKANIAKYVVSAYLKGNCGPQIKKDSFFVNQKFQIKIEKINDTICAKQKTIALTSNYKNTTWVVNNVKLIGNILTLPNVTKTYTIVAQSDDCTISDTKTILVLEDKILAFQHQINACQTLNYTPVLKDNTLQNVKYSFLVNGNLVTTFPIKLQGDSTIYKIVATYTDYCGTQTSSDSFFVFQKRKINIDNKTPKEVCLSIKNIQLTSDYPTTTWTINEQNLGSNFDLTKGKIGYNIIVASDASGCTTPDTIVIKIIDDKVKISSPVANPICYNSTAIQLVVLPINNGVWQGPGTDANGKFSTKLAGAGTHQINYKYKIPNTACIAQDSIIMKVVAPVDTFAQVGCDGFKVTLKLFVKDSISSVYWNFGDGQTSTQNDTTITHTYPKAGKYTVVLKGTLLGCDTIFTKEIIVEEKAEANFEMVSEICEGLVLNLKNTSKGSNLKFRWLLGNKVIGIDSIAPKGLKFSVNKDSIVTLSLEILNGCGKNIIQKSLKIKAKPNANFGTLLPEYCSGEAFYLVNTTFGATDYVWYKNNVTYSNQNQIDTLILFTKQINTAYNFTLVGTNSCGSDSVSVIINIKPTDVKASFTINKKTICVGEDLQITSNATKNAIVKYALGNGTFVKQETFKFSYQAAGKYRIVQYVYGCGFDSTFADIEVLPLPEITLQSTAVACLKKEIKLEVVKTNAIDVVHYFENGDSSKLFMLNYLYKNSGKFNIKTIATSANGCKLEVKTPVEIYPLPKVDFAISNAIPCQNQLVDFFSSLTNVKFEYHSDLLGGEVSNNPAPSFYYTVAKTYYPYLKVTDGNTCVDSLIKQIEVKPAPEAGFEVSVGAGCPPLDVKLSDKSSGAVVYTYFTSDNKVDKSKSPTFSYLNGGVFTVTQYVNNQTCADTLIKTFKIKTVPIVNVNVIPLSCHKSEDGKVVVIPKLGTDMTTLFNDTYNKKGITSFEKLIAGTYYIKTTSLDGCSISDTVKVSEPEKIDIKISNRDTLYISYGGIDTLDVVTNKAGLNYIWDSMIGFLKTTITNNNRTITIAPPTDILYHLTVVDSSGCKATSKVWVLIDKRYKVYVPTVFSPNEDGVNDNFTLFAELKNVEIVKEMKIFDRWGNEVFSNRNFMPDIEAEGWNGTYRGEPAAAGVYVYNITILFKDGTTHDFKGDVQLIR